MRGLNSHASAAETAKAGSVQRAREQPPEWPGHAGLKRDTDAHKAFGGLIRTQAPRHFCRMLFIHSRSMPVQVQGSGSKATSWCSEQQRHIAWCMTIFAVTLSQPLSLSVCNSSKTLPHFSYSVFISVDPTQDTSHTTSPQVSTGQGAGDCLSPFRLL